MTAGLVNCNISGIACIHKVYRLVVFLDCFLHGLMDVGFQDELVIRTVCDNIDKLVD